MIRCEFYKERKDGVRLYRTYSDENYRIRQVETGNVYDEAIDVENVHWTYEETNDKIELIEESEPNGTDSSINN